MQRKGRGGERKERWPKAPFVTLASMRVRMGSLRHHLAQTIWISRAIFASTQPQPQRKGHENEMKWQEMYRCGVLLPRVVIDLLSVRPSVSRSSPVSRGRVGLQSCSRGRGARRRRRRLISQEVSGHSGPGACASIARTAVRALPCQQRMPYLRRDTANGIFSLLKFER